MAILCRDVGLLFLQAPHTGSTSIGTLLREQLGGEKLLESRVRDARGRIVLRQKHQTLRELLDAGLVTPEERTRLLVVVGDRNPFDLVFTEYARHRKRGRISWPQRLRSRFAGSIGEISASDFEQFVRRRYAPGPLYRLVGRATFKPHDYLEGADRIIRFERMQEDLDDALREVGVTERIQIPHRNATEKRLNLAYSDYYTPRARQIVEAAYSTHLRRVDYRFDGSWGESR